MADPPIASTDSNFHSSMDFYESVGRLYGGENTKETDKTVEKKTSTDESKTADAKEKQEIWDQKVARRRRICELRVKRRAMLFRWIDISAYANGLNLLTAGLDCTLPFILMILFAFQHKDFLLIPILSTIEICIGIVQAILVYRVYFWKSDECFEFQMRNTRSVNIALCILAILNALYLGLSIGFIISHPLFPMIFLWEKVFLMALLSLLELVTISVVIGKIVQLVYEKKYIAVCMEWYSCGQ